MSFPSEMDEKHPLRTLSVLIPLYNEEEFILELLRRVISAPLPEGFDRELIVVDDCSGDGSAELVESFIAAHSEVRIRLLRHARNRGKGAAIRTAIAAATGEFSIVQDADLEYDPNEYPRLMAPLVSGQADAVFGSRFVVAGERRVLYFWHSLANQILTLIGNIASDLNLTDMETCYKLVRTSLLKSIPLTNDRFGMEPELTIKLARRKARIYEVPISYHGRTYEEGKKIGLKDAFEALWVMFRARFTKHIHTDAGHESLDAVSAAPKFNRWMADTIRPWVGQRVLEIGAGMGNMTRQLCARRKLYVATDLDEEHMATLSGNFRHRPSLRTARLDAENAGHFQPFAGEMDTVICLNVLEHIKDDHGTLQRIRTLLQPGGRLILLVPNDPRAYGSVDEAIGHFRRYTKATLTAAVEGAGYQLEEMLEFNRVSMPGWRFTGQVLKARTLSSSTLKIFDAFVWLWRRIDKSLPWQPTSIIAIARNDQ
jgi:2-polyprenyl-3-methyl-5-hydroxy-6-metoxy-1,4-benzoquinol methylase